MKTEQTTTYQGIGFPGLLTIVFITLKLLGKIDWSWWWVLSPLWISVAVIIGALVIIGCFVGIVAAITAFLSSK